MLRNEREHHVGDETAKNFDHPNGCLETTWKRFSLSCIKSDGLVRAFFFWGVARRTGIVG